MENPLNAAFYWIGSLDFILISFIVLYIEDKEVMRYGL